MFSLLLEGDMIGDSIQSVNHVTAVVPVIGWFCGLETMTPGFLCKWRKKDSRTAKLIPIISVTYLFFSNPEWLLPTSANWYGIKIQQLVIIPVPLKNAKLF